MYSPFSPLHPYGDAGGLSTFEARDVDQRLTSLSPDGVSDILVVDDDHAIRELLCAALQDEGLSIDVATDGAEALARLQQHHYRMLLLDLIMPNVDGLGVLATLRAETTLRPPVVIVISALQQQADVLSALEAGADDYITKPFDVAGLVLRTRLWLRRSSPSTPVHQPGLHVHSLGRFYVEAGGTLRLQANARARKATTLFKYLLTHEGRAVATDEICALLWPQLSQEVAAMDLRSLLYQLRKLLGLSAHSSSQLEHTGAMLMLRLGPTDWWDVAEFTARLAEGQRWQRVGATTRALDAYAAAIALYAGDYLCEDTYADWARPAREQGRAQWLEALEALAILHGERGEHGEQEQVLRAVLRADPYREQTYRTLMHLLVTRGRSAEALVLYRQLDALVRDELDADPDPETQALAQRIRKPPVSA